MAAPDVDRHEDRHEDQHVVVEHRSAAALGADWDAFGAHHPFAARRWLAMTEACFRDYEPSYLEVRSRGRLVGAAVVARQQHFNTSAYVADQRFLALSQRALATLPPMSVQVAPYGFTGLVAPEGAPATATTPLVLDTIHRIARRGRSPFVGFNALEAPDPALAAAGYAEFATAPEAVVDLHVDSYAQFEQQLAKKHREEVRRVRNRARGSGVTLDVIGIDRAPAADVERLMLGVTAKHHNAFSYHPGLVARAREHLDDDHHRMLVARIDGHAVATVSVFRDGRFGVLKWMGLDYDRAGPAHAYHLVMTEAVAQAIDLGIETLVLGATSYVLKKKLGARLEPRLIAARPTSRALGRAVTAGRSAAGRLARLRHLATLRTEDAAGSGAGPSAAAG